MLAKLLTVLLAAIMLVHGAVIVPPVAPVDSTDDYGHWATFTDVDTNFTFDLHSLGHTGPAQIISLNASNYPAWSKFTPYNSLDVDSRPLQEWGDVCSKVSSCYQKISDTANTAMIFIANTNFPRCAAIGGAVYEFFVADNYRNTVGVIVNGAIVSTAISYINAPVQKVIINSAFGGGEGDGEDSCDVRTSEMMANDYSAMVAQFCLSIASATDKDPQKQQSHYFTGDVARRNYSAKKGAYVVNKNFIAAQKHVFADKCEEFGIVF